MSNYDPTRLAFGFWFPSPLLSAVIADTPDSLKAAHKKSQKKTGFRPLLAYNIILITGYFPIVGIIAGVVRDKLCKSNLYSVYCKEDKFQNFVKIQLFRSRLEIAGFGSLLLFVDIIFTLGRKFTKSLI